jgi:hypothetical protein
MYIYIYIYRPSDAIAAAALGLHRRRQALEMGHHDHVFQGKVAAPNLNVEAAVVDVRGRRRQDSQLDRPEGALQLGFGHGPHLDDTSIERLFHSRQKKNNNIINYIINNLINAILNNLITNLTNHLINNVINNLINNLSHNLISALINNRTSNLTNNLTNDLIYTGLIPTAQGLIPTAQSQRNFLKTYI